jgi:hypothetical protein
MTPVREASCQCGQLRVRAQGEPVRVSVCHCLDCQKRSGSAFAFQARFPAERVAIEGEAREWTRAGDESGGAVFSFCPQCGSTVYYRGLADPEMIAVAVGAFGEPDFPPPHYSVYETRKHAWLTISGDIEHYD